MARTQGSSTRALSRRLNSPRRTKGLRYVKRRRPSAHTHTHRRTPSPLPIYVHTQVPTTSQAHADRTGASAGRRRYVQIPPTHPPSPTLFPGDLPYPPLLARTQVDGALSATRTTAAAPHNGVAPPSLIPMTTTRPPRPVEPNLLPSEMEEEEEEDDHSSSRGPHRLLLWRICCRRLRLWTPWACIARPGSLGMYVAVGGGGEGRGGGTGDGKRSAVLFLYICLRLI